MAIVVNRPVYRKCFFAHLKGVSGTLAQLQDGIYFFHQESGELQKVDSYKDLTVLGEVGLSQLQYILDEMDGGLARVVCSRQEGRQ